MNKSSTKSKKGFKSLVSLLLVAAILITGALAYLTATDSKENKFTVGNVSIKLTEPNWDANNPDGTLENIVPDQTIPKDPQIENTGKNDAYVYIMVTVPKKDQIAVNENGTKVVKDNLQLFTYDVNENWTLIESKSDDANENNYYVYAYNTTLAPQGKTAALFEEVTFANIVSGQIESTEKLEILVNGYAIQSNNVYDAEGNLATAEEAWDIYATQNGWDWPYETPAGQSTLTFLDENDTIVHSITAEEGSPVDMYFENSLAKTGYTFDWVDANTGDVAYSGMPMPENDTELEATYTSTGYEDKVLAGRIKYTIYGNNTDGYTLTCDGINTTETTWVIPASVTVTGNGVKDPSDDFKEGLTAEAFSIQYATDAEPVNGTYEVPVTSTYIISSSVETLVLPDTIKSATIYAETSLKKLILPYGIEYFNFSSTGVQEKVVEEVYLPNSLTELRQGTFRNCLNLKTITVPGSVPAIEDNTFNNCPSLETAVINYGVTSIGTSAFSGCSALKSVTIPSTITTINNSAFIGCSNLTDVYFDGTEEQWNAITIAAGNTELTDANIHFES